MLSKLRYPLAYYPYNRVVTPLLNIKPLHRQAPILQSLWKPVKFFEDWNLVTPVVQVVGLILHI